VPQDPQQPPDESVSGVSDAATHGAGEGSAAQLPADARATQGQTFDQWVRTDDPGWNEILKVFYKVGQKLAAAHKKDLIHGGFTSSDIVIDSKGRVHVSNFGLSSDQDGHGVGCFPPELSDDVPPNKRTDQFQYCVALYEALFLIHPFGSGNQTRMADRAASGAIQPPAKESQVPAHVLRAVLRGLNADPDLRFASIEDLLKEIGRHPRKRSLRLLSIGLSAGLIGICAMVLARQGVLHRILNTSQTEQVEAIWNDEVRRRLATAFENSGYSFAPQTALHVKETLDHYSHIWSSAFSKVIRAQKQNQASTTACQLECLEQRLGELNHLILTFLEPTPNVVASAAELLPELRDPGICTNQLRFAAQSPPLTDSASRADLAELRSTLAQARILELTGSTTDAAELLTLSADDFDSSSYQPLVSEYLLLKGRLENELGRESAEQILVDSFFAAEKGGADAPAAEAAVELFRFFSVIIPDDVLARRWQRIAESKLSRLHHPPDLERHLTAAQAEALERDGLYEDASELRLRLFDLSLTLAGDDSVGAALAHERLAATLLSVGRQDETLDHLQRAVQIKEQHLGDNHPSLVPALTAVGSSLSYSARNEEALRSLERALSIAEAAFGEDSKHLGSTLNTMAFAFEALGQLDRALAIQERAHGLVIRASGERHPDVAYSLLNRVSLRRKAGQYRSGLEEAQEAAQILEDAFGREHPMYAYAVEARGMMQLGIGNPAAGVADLERALRIRTAMDDDPVLVARTRLNLARCLWEAGTNRNRALQLAYTARAELSDVGDRGRDDLRDADSWLAERTAPPAADPASPQ
jgi:tetratricopeptide (TPR) repeat protein